MVDSELEWPMPGSEEAHPPFLIEVFNEDRNTRLRKRVFEADIERVLRGYKVERAVIRVIFLDARAHRQLNLDFLGHDYDTDVITFPIEEEPLEGEVYVNVDEGRRQAKERRIPHYLEWRRLVIHGTLHLLGFDDATDTDRVEMRLKEDHYLRFDSR